MMRDPGFQRALGKMSGIESDFSLPSPSLCADRAGSAPRTYHVRAFQLRRIPRS